MAKPSHQNENFYAHRKGPKRSTRTNEWYEDSTGNREAQSFFSATPNGVPNNPNNFQSFTPASSHFAPSGQPDGDVVFRRNPYGDGEQIVEQDTPVAAKPTQMGGYFNNAPTDPKLGNQAFMQTPGPATGMSTGFGGFGNGPGRNVKRGSDKSMK